MNPNKRFKCPFCSVHDTKEKLINHIDKKHTDMIPEGFSAARVLFHSIHKRPYNVKGTCVICKGETEWNERTYKYNRLCNRRECKEKLRESYKKNMLKVYGTYNILNDMDQQEKMLRNRSISGIYTFRNGKIKQFVGSYEKKFLEFCDLMLNMDPDDIMMPGPTIEYDYKGQKHQWITDAMIIPYNLIIDVKDGGDFKNNREMISYREKQLEKEKVITNKGEYNYLRLTNNEFDQLIGIIYELKMQMIDDPETTKTISRVHENFNIPKLTVTMYHGSHELYKVLKPVAVNLGTKFSKPRWSLFLWPQEVLAFKWAAFRTILENLRPNFNDKEFARPRGNPVEKSYFDYDYRFCVINTDYNKLMKASIGLPFYVYVVEMPIDSKAGFGNNDRQPEYTYDKPLKPKEIKKYKITEKIFKEVFTPVSEREWELQGEPETFPSVRGALSPIFHDYYDIMKRWGSIHQKIHFGEMKPGDHIDDYDELYDPPMSERQIRAKYPDKAEMLLNDPVHGWRARRGIELIHKEPSKEELERIWKNWNKMSEKQKKESDEYSKKLFGKTNKDNYKELIKSYDESSQPIFISEDDLEIKLDDWKDGKIKCLFIAGMSGGGKSTLANNLAKEYGAIMIEMDLITWFLKVGKDIPVEPPYKLIEWHKYKTHKPYPDDKEMERISIDKLFKKNMICDYLEWVIHKTPKQFVIEGPIDDIIKYRPELLEDSALIVKGTSTLTSAIRRIKRDFTRTDRPMDGIGIKYLTKVLFKDYPKYQKDMNSVRDYVDSYTESSQPLLISEKDVEYKVDDFKNHKVPILWITGQSGGGKTTTARKLADEMNCDLLEIDGIERLLHRIAEKDTNEVNKLIKQDKNFKIIYDFAKNNKQLIEDCTIKRNWNEAEWENHFKKLFVWIHKLVKLIVSKYTNSNQLIAEGVQVPYLYFKDKSLFKNSAIIVKGTSTITSLTRRLKRDNPTFGSIKDIPGTLDNIFGYLKMYKDWHKDISEFKDKGPIKESVEEEKEIIDSMSNQEKWYLGGVRKNPVFQYVHKVDGKPVGFVDVMKDTINDKKGLYIDIGVKPEYRGSGVAQKLIEKAVSWFDNQDEYENLRYYLNFGNDQSLNFIKKNSNFELQKKSDKHKKYIFIHSKNSITEAVDIPEVKISDIQFIKDLKGSNNSYIDYKGKHYRVRVETLIVNDKGEIYVQKKDELTAYGAMYKLPGGSAEPNTEFITQAENEIHEEAMLRVNNIYYTGYSYTSLYGSKEDPYQEKYLTPLGFKYEGSVTYVYIAEYVGKYHGYVKVIDRTSMAKEGKFYKYKDIKWLPEHKKALEDYFKSHKVLKESSDTMDDVIRTGKDKEYDEYLKIHKGRLVASYNNRVYALKNALLLSDEEVNELRDRIQVHDASRYSKEEWDDWRKSYFPKDDIEREEGKESEKKARAHHYKVNAHHPEHWNGKEMDKVSIAEMIIDWEADSKADGGNPLKWYTETRDGRKTSMKLNPKTREIVERVLNIIYDINMNLKDTKDGYNDPHKEKKED